jgi:hypothetical protein
MAWNTFRRSTVVALLVCVSALFSAKSAAAQLGTIGPSNAEVVGVIVAIVAVGVAIGVTAVLVVRHHPTLTGCVAAAPDGVTLNNESDQAVFTLTGNTSALRAGERVRVIGHKEKKGPAGERVFSVDEVRKDYGACKLPPSGTRP